MMDQALTEIVTFWREAGPAAWFARDPAFDARFRERFLGLYEAAVGAGADAAEKDTPAAALGRVLALDQFPRNAFRGTARMFATDPLARQVADRAIANEKDAEVEPPMRLFFYLPFEHSEALADQERAVALIAPLGSEYADFARLHLDVIRRFGRFPHRNAILGRASTPQERAFLEAGGFSG